MEKESVFGLLSDREFQERSVPVLVNLWSVFRAEIQDVVPCSISGVYRDYLVAQGAQILS